MARSGAPERLALGDLGAARRSFARITRAFYRGEIEEPKARALAYMFNTLCGLFKAEQEADLERRLDEIEAAIAGKVAEAGAEKVFTLHVEQDL
jgi:hypothetical protein